MPVCPYCYKAMVEDKAVERKGEEKMFWYCENCGIECKIWSRR